MLTQMRKGAASWPAKILLGAIALSFVVWGMGGLFTERNVNVVAQVGPVDIGIRELQYAYRNRIQSLQDNGVQVDQGSDLARLLAGIALDEMIQNTLYRVTADDMGVTVGDDTVRGDIAGNALFQDDQGRFDVGKFSMLLQQNGLTETRYVEGVRQQIADGQLQKGIGAVPPAPDMLVNLIYGFRNERRVVEAAVIPNEVLAPDIEPEAGALESYFAANPDKYQAPEYRSADYILAYPADLAAEMQVSDEELQQAYDANAARWVTPEKRHVERLAFETQEAATAAAEQAAGGADFATVAADNGAEVLDLGMVGRSDLFGDLGDAVFSLDDDAVSGPVASPLGGWLVFHVSAIEPEQVTSFEDARDQVREEVANEKAYDALYRLANDLDDMLAGGSTVAEAADALGVELRTIDKVTMDGSAADPMSLQAVPDAPEFLDELFAGELDFPSPVVETSDGGVMAIEVTTIDPARPLTFEEAQADVLADWREAEQAELAHQAIETRVAGLASTDMLASALAGLPASVTRLAPFLRTDTPELAGVGLDAVTALFNAAPGDVVVMPADGQQAQVVARLIEIQPASPADDAEAADALRDTLTSAWIADVGDEFRGYMRGSQDISVDQAMIDQYF